MQYYQQKTNNYNYIIEKNQSNSVINKFQVVNPYDDYDDRLILLETKRTKSSLQNILYDLFLPSGYPDSVTSDYFRYQFWDSIQALCSSITGTLATRAILKGYGVGNSSATVASATTQWVIQSATGMIGRIIFAWANGTDLDCNSKKWRFMADILNDIGMTFEMISPLFNEALFLPLSCIGLFAKSICGVAGGCTKASLTQHFAKNDNLADVSAKDGSQETAVSLLGMILSVFVSSVLNDDTSILVTWFIFFIFTGFHLYCNYKAVSAVQLNSINKYRAHLIYEYYIRNQGSIPSPKEISNFENILFNSKDFKIRLGVSLCNIYKEQQKQDIVNNNNNNNNNNSNMNNNNNNMNNNNNKSNNTNKNNTNKNNNTNSNMNNNNNNNNNINNNNNEYYYSNKIKNQLNSYNKFLKNKTKSIQNNLNIQVNNRDNNSTDNISNLNNLNLDNNSYSSSYEIIKKIKKSKSFIIWKKCSQKDNKINEKDFTLLIALLNSSTTRDMIESYFYSIEYAHISSNNIPPTVSINSSFFKRLEELGWQLDRNLLNSEGYTFGI
ncbi:hypothetical protein DICPUDRAFT_153796 [Dictyostelium purpureum]|uniref:Protein root UVB sensitive/RUS domain-containing protein n=1 Tax=Dictyostelium purpureum TaxID=5786 RepID=F0ZPS1_DICPU|nr:uncharacterized protein DICPUDRAFT_153796 [Dictyostelium purpureum]EGC34058.1 hypothetical protein DICPUDRAFT_153796 [Dictyostelium purpureum]|eukprot:XP_003289422.1 hypothetical protein DICPUDRAFT_153796 [Dictyostelium purpureum]